MSAIQSFLQRFWPQQKSHKVFVAGLDNSGKTTLLYKLLLDEVINAIPTIGFNIETISVPSTSRGSSAIWTKQKVHSVTLWDIGGCGRVNPLRGVYLAGPEPFDAVIWVVDAADSGRTEEVVQELKLFLEELGEYLTDKPFLVLAHKSDLPNARPAVDVTMLLKDILAGRLWHVFSTTVNTPIPASGFPEAFDWLDTVIQLANKNGDRGSDSKAQNQQRNVVQANLEKGLAQAMDGTSPSTLLEQFRIYSLPSWDHFTHIRLAYTILKIHGRQKGKNMIFDGIERYIANTNSNSTTGRSLHVTMTYFWVQIVHFALRSVPKPVAEQAKSTPPGSREASNTHFEERMNPVNAMAPPSQPKLDSLGSESTQTYHAQFGEDFCRFLLLNPYVVDSGLWQDYYSKDMMMSPEAKNQMVLPDKKPLPNVIERDNVKSENLATSAK